MRSPQLPPWPARRRGSDKDSVDARGASAAGMVCCWHLVLLLCRSFLILTLVARLQATPPIKVNSTHFEALAEANRERRCPEPKQKKVR